MIKRYIGISLLTASVLVAGCSSDDDDPVVVDPPAAVPYVAPEGTTLDLLETASNDPRFTTLLQALADAGLGDAFSAANTTGANTIFAPTNDAFTAFETANPGIIAGLEQAELIDLLTFHVNDDIEGVDAAAVTAAVGTAGLTMSNGKVAEVTSSEAGLQIAGAQISTADVYATNGIIHVLDALMTLPPEVVEPPVTGDHIIADLEARGDHAIFLGLISTDLSATLAGPNGDPPMGWTIFAPTDAAFDGVETASLSDDDKRALVLRHVISGQVASTALATGVQLMNTGSVDVVVDAGTGGITIGGANVTTADIASANGILHVVDGVLALAAAQ